MKRVNVTVAQFAFLALAGAAVLILLLAAPALSQQVRGDPSVTVYESPT